MNFNVNIPLTKVYIKPDFLGLTGNNLPGYWYGITSIPGRGIGCHVMLESGANWARLPLNSLLHKDVQIETVDLKQIQMWDCFSYDIQCIRFNFLREQPIIFLDNNLKGNYLFTVDSIDSEGGSPFSEFPEQHKTFTICSMKDGTIRSRPNNMIRWIDNALYNNIELPKFKRIDKIFKAEE